MRGRPTNPDITKRVLQAALEIVTTAGHGGFTMDAVAKRAGVPKCTIYSRWPSKGALLADAMVSMAPPARGQIDTGSLRSDLEAMIRSNVAAIGDARLQEIVFSLLIELQASPAAAISLRERTIAPRRRSGLLLLQRGIARGEVDPMVDLDAALDMLLGAIRYRFLTRVAPLNDSFAAELAQQVAASVRSTPATSGRHESIRPGSFAPIATSKSDCREDDAHPSAIGRPADREITARILEVTVSLVAERGCAALTMDEVARRARVPKSTIYRRWSSKGALLVDAYVSVASLYQQVIDTGSLRRDLESAQTEDFAAMRDTRVARLAMAILAECQSNRELAVLIGKKILVGRRQQRKEMLLRGTVRGEVAPTANLEVALDMELGAMWYRIVCGFIPVDPGYPLRLAAQLERALRNDAERHI
jgi:AcrR family transcriptional regulator